MFLSLLIGLIFLYIVLIKCGVVEKLSMPKGSTIKSSCEYEIIENNSQVPAKTITVKTENTAPVPNVAQASAEPVSSSETNDSVPEPSNATPSDYSVNNKTLTLDQAKFNPNAVYSSSTYTGKDNYAAFCHHVKEKGICTRSKQDEIRKAFDNQWCKNIKCKPKLKRDPRSFRSEAEQLKAAKKKLNKNLVRGYENKGKYRLLAGNSGWGYQQRIGGSTDECAKICNSDNKCRGFTTTTYTNGKKECMLYNKGQNPNAKFREQCATDPGSVKACRAGVNGELYWKSSPASVIEQATQPEVINTGDACLLTDKTFDEGARCEGSGYRKTADWCCSKYGRKKGFKWKIP